MVNNTFIKFILAIISQWIFFMKLIEFTLLRTTSGFSRIYVKVAWIVKYLYFTRLLVNFSSFSAMLNHSLQLSIVSNLFLVSWHIKSWKNKKQKQITTKRIFRTLLGKISFSFDYQLISVILKDKEFQCITIATNS